MRPRHRREACATKKLYLLVPKLLLGNQNGGKSSCFFTSFTEALVKRSRSFAPNCVPKQELGNE